jgi:hypothetical protein
LGRGTSLGLAVALDTLVGVKVVVGASGSVRVDRVLLEDELEDATSRELSVR